MSKFFGQKDGLTASIIDGYAGAFSHLIVRASGTNQAGKTAAITDFGVIRVDFQGRPIANINMANLGHITNLFYGEIEAVSAAGAAFAFTVLLPFRGPNDKNILHVWNDRDLKIYMPAASGGAAIFAALAYTVKAEEAFGPELYIPQLFESSETLTALYTPTLSLPNLIWLGLSTAAVANPTWITLTRDGVLKKEGSLAELIAETNAFSEMESLTENMAVLRLLESGNPLEAVGHSYYLVETGGNGVQTITQFGAIFDSARSARSKVAVAQIAGGAAAREPSAVASVTPGVIQAPYPRITRGPTTPPWGVL